MLGLRSIWRSRSCPSLRSYPADQLKQSYQRARRQAAKQTEMPLEVFPEDCPYALALVLDEDWLPEADN